MKNHLGSYECKLCLTLHNNEGNYLAHTQGKRHQTNIARRAAREQQDAAPSMPPTAGSSGSSKPAVRRRVKIGRPGYTVIKQKDPETGLKSLRFEIDYPEIEEGMQPRHSFMSTYEQRIEQPDKRFQYLLFAAEPYETIGFKIPSWKIVKDFDKKEALFTHWDPVSCRFVVRQCWSTCCCC